MVCVRVFRRTQKDDGREFKTLVTLCPTLCLGYMKKYEACVFAFVLRARVFARVGSTTESPMHFRCAILGVSLESSPLVYWGIRAISALLFFPSLYFCIAIGRTHGTTTEHSAFIACFVLLFPGVFLCCGDLFHRHRASKGKDADHPRLRTFILSIAVLLHRDW